MAKKASKKPTPASKLLESLLTVLHKDGDLGGAEDAGTMRDGTLTTAIVMERLGKRLEHNARTVQIIAAGLQKISHDLNNQVADIDSDMEEAAKEHDSMWNEAFMASGRGPEFGTKDEQRSAAQKHANEAGQPYLVHYDDGTEELLQPQVPSVEDPDDHMVYIGWFDSEDGTKYYGPTNYTRACEMVNSLGGNIDIVPGVPTDAEPIEKLPIRAIKRAAARK